jgi:hypothetical protein
VNQGAAEEKVRKNSIKRGGKGRTEVPIPDFQDRCLKPLGHPSVFGRSGTYPSGTPNATRTWGQAGGDDPRADRVLGGREWHSGVLSANGMTHVRQDSPRSTKGAGFLLRLMLRRAAGSFCQPLSVRVAPKIPVRLQSNHFARTFLQGIGSAQYWPFCLPHQPSLASRATAGQASFDLS